MAIPFTRWATFISQNVPKVTALFLNQWQDSLAAVAYPAYGRIPVTGSCVNSSWVTFAVIPPYMALDAVTSQYVGMPAATAVQVASGFVNGWNYIYTRVSSGVAAYSVATTAPEATLRYKTGDETYRYLCCVFVSAGNLKNFHVTDFDYVYGEQQLAGSNVTTTGGSYTTLSLANYVPPTTQRIRLEVQNLGTNVLNQFNIRPTGTSWTGTTKFVVAAATGYYQKEPMDMFTNSSQQIDYSFVNVTGSPHANIWVDGFKE